MKDILIGIDAGTSVIKSVAFDATGKQIGACSVPNDYRSVPGNGVEQDMHQTWASTIKTLKGLGEKIPDLASRTMAIAVTGQGDGTWLIDADGEPVAPGWLWLDGRAIATVDEMRARPEDRQRFERTGTGLAACQQGAQLAWIKQHAPEHLQGATTAFHCKDWLYFKLTGTRATDPSEGCFTYGDFRKAEYSDEVVSILGLDDLRHLLPPMVDGTTQSHPLSGEAASACGLLAGTPIVLGYVDVVCTSMGAGLYERNGNPGCSVIGSTGMHMRLVRGADDIYLNEDATGYTMVMPVPGILAQMQSNMAATLNIDWLLGMASDLFKSQNVERSPSQLLGEIETWIENAHPASLMYQPYISESGERGPFIDGNARAGFVGLSQQHGFGDMMRAVIEGLAFAARDCYLASGPLPKEVRLSGGAARSSSLRSILSATLNANVRTSAREEAGAAGAAMIAAVCLGQYDDMNACADQWVTPLLGEVEKPDPDLAALYEQAYPAYAAAHNALRPIWRQMAGIRGK